MPKYKITSSDGRSRTVYADCYYSAESAALFHGFRNYTVTQETY